MNTKKTLLQLILKKCAENRGNARGLVDAYIQELVEDAEDEGLDTDYAAVGVVVSEEECSAVMQEAFMKAYRAGCEASEETALEVFMYPVEMPSENVPREVLVAVGREQGKCDAFDTLEIQREAAILFYSHKA